MKEEYIPGIYNYCDRWCERCHFTSRCRNYEGTSKLTPQQLDIKNEAFWEHISTSFKEAAGLLIKAAEKFGIDLNAPLTAEEEAAYKKKEAFIKTTSKQHILSQLCKKYQENTRPFVKASEGFVDKVRVLVSHLHLGMKTPEDVAHTVADVGDCFDIIQWYLYLIDAKLQRALQGKISGEDWEDENGFQKDSDGSAKIAIIGIDRSIAAWSELYNQLPASEDTILTSLSLLSQLKERAIDEFPLAMQFKRPGFDD